MESDRPLVERLPMPAKANWTHPLPFMMVSEDKFGTEEKLEPELVDLMSILDTSYKGTYRYYFPSKYKPSDPVGHQLLANDLRSVGLSHGVKFARQGGGPKTGIYPMVCQCGLFYRSNRNAPNFTGGALPKKSKRPKKGLGSTCKARLTFHADQKHDRFSIHAYNGQRYHNDHHQLKSTEIPIGTKDLRVETVKLGQPMHSSELNRSSIRNLAHKQSSVGLNGDPSPAIGKSENKHPWPLITPKSPVIQLPHVPPPPTYNGQRYHNDHHQFKGAKIPIANKDLRGEREKKTVRLGQSMHATEINLYVMRNRFHQQHGIALRDDLSPTIEKSEYQHPWMPVTPESPATQPPDVLPPPGFSFRDDCSDDQHQDGEASEPVPNDSTQKITFSQDDSRVKESAMCVDFKHHPADMSRLNEGHGFEEVVSCLMLLGREVVLGAHSCPTSREQMRDFSRQTRAVCSKRQPPSCQEALSKIRRVLLPNEQEQQSCGASVKTKAQYNTLKRKAEEVTES
jgi:hypothetical protein